MKRLLVAALIFGSLLSGAMARNCNDDELTFNFSNLPVRQAFAILADFAGLRPQIDPSIQQSEAMRFECVNWRVVAEDLARKHDLNLEIKDGVMSVRKK
jgi:type II secretory pathway component GspD/PulD (secretin)